MNRRWRIWLANRISGHINHYEDVFPTETPPWPLTKEWLDDTEAKLRECLNDRFCDDAAAVMLNLLLHLRADAHGASMPRLKELSAFESDALETSRRLREVAAVIEGRYPGGAAICERGARLIWEQTHRSVLQIPTDLAGNAAGGEPDD